ncbi:MAG: metallophosphoesterase [Bacteroidales bacterium]|nr:metallophosphoesterase [Bacteroidales bacterium]
MEQVFFIADFHLGDHDVFTKDENGRRMNVNVAVRDNWLLDMWMSQVGKKDCVYILGDLMAYRGETGENLLSRLPGKKYLIEGNHDENLRAFPGQFRSVELMMNKVFSPMVYPFLKERLSVTMCPIRCIRGTGSLKVPSCFMDIHMAISMNSIGTVWSLRRILA